MKNTRESGVHPPCSETLKNRDVAMHDVPYEHGNVIGKIILARITRRKSG